MPLCATCAQEKRQAGDFESLEHGRQWVAEHYDCDSALPMYTDAKYAPSAADLRIAIASTGLDLAGERSSDLHEVSGAFGAEGTPTPNHGRALTCGDGINPVDNQPAIADPVSVREPRPSALAREALLTDYASAQVSHLR